MNCNLKTSNILGGSTMRRVFSTLAFAALTIGLDGCYQTPELVDRTQPNYLRKSDIQDGSWYIQQTVVDVPPTSPIAVIGYSGGLEKVRFEVQEEHLVAYRTYEYLPGSDPLVDASKSGIGRTVNLDGTLYRGAPIAAWPILSHFDRQRQYNAATGEQNNVLEENTSDRPWYKREFMRVNWATNLVGNPQFSLEGEPSQFNAFKTFVTPVDQNLGDNAFFTHYSGSGERKQLDYFDFTVRSFVNPPTVYYPGYGSIPYCWLEPRVDCAAAEVKIRNSVRRVDDARVRDYEPLVYGDTLNKKFGYFRTDRVTYDRDRGVTESGRITFANRHNIWKQARDEQGNSIPVEERDLSTLRPVVYYLTNNWPESLLGAAKAIEKTWDDAFRKAVAVPRNLNISDVPQMFYVCQTPVPKGAPAECGPEGLNVRLGDLRYNQLPWIDVDQISGPLGLGPSAADPETGEIIQGVANVYGAGIDRLAGAVQQWVNVLNGDVSIQDLVDGKDVRDFVFQNLNPTDPRRPASGPWVSKDGLQSDPRAAMASFYGTIGTLKAKIDFAKLQKRLPPLTQDRRAVVEQMVAQNPALESELIDNPEVRAMVLASAPNPEFRQRLLNDASFYRQVARQSALLTGELRKLESARVNEASLMEHNGCLYKAEFADDIVMGLAMEMKELKSKRVAAWTSEGKDAATAERLASEDVYNKIREGITIHIGAHEVGHTLGLMHNFIGSFDALNYQDGFWNLRKDTIGVVVNGTRVLPTTPRNLVDAARKNERQIASRMGDYQYSSIMDYGARMYSDKGIGKYDSAAILFAYSGGAGQPGYVEVFQETRGKQDKDYRPGATNMAVPTDIANKTFLVRGAHVEIPLAHVRHYTPTSDFYSDRFHYTTLPFHFADKPQSPNSFNFESALEQGIARMANRGYKKWSSMEPIYAQIDKAYQGFQLDLGTALYVNSDQAALVYAASDVNMPQVEVPYMFCSDYEVGSNVACNRWDYGADLYEMTRDWLDRYENYYVFNAFRRDRLTFDPNTYLSAVDRYLGNLPNVYQQWLFNIFFYQFYYGYTTEQMAEYQGVGDPVYQNYWTMAVMDGTNTLLQIMSRPSVGYHGKRSDGIWEYLNTNNANNTRLEAAKEAAYISSTKAAGYTDVVYVPRGVGKSMFSTFDTKGYDYYTRINEIGYFWDQISAMSALTTSDTNFLGVDRGSDALRYSLPYYMTFNRELAQLFGDIWTDRKTEYAGKILKTADGLGTFIPPTFVKAEEYISGFKYPLTSGSLVDSTTSTGELVEASPTWSTRFYAQLWGMAYFSANFNQEFPSLNQIFRVGSGEEIAAAPGFTLKQFSDPFGGGYIYGALQPNNVTKLTPAAYAVQSAIDNSASWASANAAPNKTFNGLTSAQWEAKVRENVRSLEMMRGLYSIFGRAL